jgi:hypothetical protein
MQLRNMRLMRSMADYRRPAERTTDSGLRREAEGKEKERHGKKN